jgi:hypothetical protein
METDLSNPIIFDVQIPASSILNYFEYQLGAFFLYKEPVFGEPIRKTSCDACNQNLDHL